ncbi:histidine phosphatase family protein [Maridesulfovibrio bastinii]|uniref:histidine phosphatase family protein n=1 Tax=Maridesulfovibrio bastinii TaxID=47157 RepID=UPI00040D78A5|nr:histidine phosphatase family protein [Maridesulfovibrio bastinii]
MKRLIIARHGNTFLSGETPTRVGARTDLPLVETLRGQAIGRYIREHNLMPDSVYAAPLKRTMQTAQLALDELQSDLIIEPLSDFIEIDYGPDENKPEAEVLLRLGTGSTEVGKQVLDAWNERTEVPEGWKVEPEKIIYAWRTFADKIYSHPDKDHTGLVVTSNGIIRFAPHLTGDFPQFAQNNKLKVATGGVCIFEKDAAATDWRCTAWNVKPFNQ